MTYDKPRNARRFDLRLPVTVLALGDSTMDERARTRNISSSGMFVELDANPQPGTPVHLVLELPPETTQCGVVRISCKGAVVRSDRNSVARTGIAVRIEQYHFQRLSE